MREREKASKILKEKEGGKCESKRKNKHQEIEEGKNWKILNKTEESNLFLFKMKPGLKAAPLNTI